VGCHSTSAVKNDGGATGTGGGGNASGGSGGASAGGNSAGGNSAGGTSAGGTSAGGNSAGAAGNGVGGAGVGGSVVGGSSGSAGTTGGGGSNGPVSFPVKPSSNSRYLVDQNGTPFPVLGRASWFVISLSPTDYQTYFSDTLSRGYDAIEMIALTHDSRANHPPFNGHNDMPFLKRLDGAAWTGSLTYSNASTAAPDMTTPNEAYWSYLDTFLAYCDAHGILVFMFPAYVGHADTDQGWMPELLANGATKVQSYGAWIANRYKGQKNLVWMMGGDQGTGSYPFSQAQVDVERALLNGIKSVAGQQSTQFSAEWASQSIATEEPNFGSSMTLNGDYSSNGDVSNYGRQAYSHNPAIPSYLLEEPYDEEGNDGNGYNSNATQPVRRFQWWGWLSTVGGYITGNGYVWPFNQGWMNHLNTQCAKDMKVLNAFIGSIPWYQLVPSGLAGMKTLVTAGAGNVSDAGYVASAATPTGSLLLAYVPPAHTGSITVDMTALSGAAQARWFNPTSGSYTAISGSPFPNTGTHQFTPPGDNGTGNSDWALVLQTQ